MAQFLYKEVAPSGGDYTSLEACMNANEQDLTGDGWFDIEITGDWSGGADTTAVTIGNWTTTAADYINIFTSGTARHNGAWSTDYYTLAPAGTDSILIRNSAGTFVYIDGLQILKTSSANYKAGINCDRLNTGSILYVSNNIVKNHSSAAAEITWGAALGAYYNNQVVTVYAWNNIAYDFKGIDTSAGFFSSGSGQTTYLYNNTAYNCTTGFNRNAGTWVAKNNLSYNNTTDFSSGFDASSDYNFSKDDTAPEAAGNSIWGTTDGKTPDFVSTTAGFEDFHLQSTSDAIGFGVDLSATFTKDIDGMFRGTSWSIGADERNSFEVAPSGGDYTSLEACMNANEQDLTGDGYMDVEITGDWTSTTDSTEVTIHNYTTTSSDYINIFTSGTARHSGSWSVAAYTRLFTTWGYVSGDEIASQYVTIDGLQFYQEKDYEGTSLVIGDGGEFATIKNNIFTARDEPPDYDPGTGLFISYGDTDTSQCLVYNNIFYGLQRGLNVDSGDNTLIYNNTIYGSVTGIHVGNLITVVFKNNVVVGNTDDYYVFGTQTTTGSSNNITEDDDMPGDTATTQNLLTEFFVSATDFHLRSTSDAIGAGTSLSGTFTTDIDGDTRSSWDIGADEYIFGWAWGEESPSEVAVSWSVWSDGASGGITVSGDSDWGKAILGSAEIGHSDVKDTGNTIAKLLTVTKDKYGTGQGSHTVYIRGQAGTFSQDDGTPSWEEYTAPVYKTWQYVQVKIVGG